MMHLNSNGFEGDFQRLFLLMKGSAGGLGLRIVGGKVCPVVCHGVRGLSTKLDLTLTLVELPDEGVEFVVWLGAAGGGGRRGGTRPRVSIAAGSTGWRACEFTG